VWHQTTNGFTKLRLVKIIYEPPNMSWNHRVLYPFTSLFQTLNPGDGMDNSVRLYWTWS
jgi:hypothetical protein